MVNDKEPVSTPVIIYDGNTLTENTPVDFSKGLSFSCNIDDVIFEYKWNDGLYTQISKGINTGSIPNGATRVTVRATKHGMNDSNEKMLNFTRVYKIGDEGPGGGIIFYLDGTGAYKEVSESCGVMTWEDAIFFANNYKNNGFSNWYLPTKQDMETIWSKSCACI